MSQASNNGGDFNTSGIPEVLLNALPSNMVNKYIRQPKNLRFLTDAYDNLWSFHTAIFDPVNGLTRSTLPVGFGNSPGLALNVLSVPSLVNAYNASTGDLQTGNLWDVLSATDTTDTATSNYQSANYTNVNCRGLMLFVKITSLTGTSVTPSIFGIDKGTGNSFNLLSASSALTGTGTSVYLVYPGAGAASAGITQTASFPLPRTFGIAVSKSSITGYAATYGVNLIV